MGAVLAGRQERDYSHEQNWGWMDKGRRGVACHGRDRALSLVRGGELGKDQCAVQEERASLRCRDGIVQLSHVHAGDAV